MADSIREQIVSALVSLFEGMQAGLPAPDPYAITWDFVTREPPGAKIKGKKYVLGVFEPAEVKAPLIGAFDATMRVVLEFWTHGPLDREPSTHINLVLGQIQRRLREDRHLGGLAADVKEVGNEIDIDNIDDRQLRGAVLVDVRYKHAVNDPRAAP